MAYEPPKRRRLSKAERQEVYDKCAGHCAYCGCEITIQQMQVDHVQPISLCGDDDLSNMLPACRSCNHYKSTLSLESLREYLGSINNRMMRDSVTYRNAVRFGLTIPNPKPVVFYFEKEAPHEQ